MIKRLTLTTALLLLLSMMALAQSAQGPTIRLTPDARFGSSCFCPGSIIKATGRIFIIGSPTPFTRYIFRVTLQPSSPYPLRIIQVAQDHILFALDVASMDGVTGIRIQGPGLDEVVPLTGPAAPAAAKPGLTNTGGYSSFQNTGGTFFDDGVVVFGPLVGINTVTLNGTDFGQINQWIMRVEGEGAAIEVPAKSAPLSQATLPYQLIFFDLPRLPSGSYSFTARAASNPSIVSNTIILTIVS